MLGDRIRMNAIDSDKIFMRSLATRDTGNELSAALPEVLACCKLSGFDLIVVETSGIGQGESGDRAARRHLALRDDARVRRGLAAREDRHARFRRFRRHQQVRPQGRRGCAARRAQAVPAQPRPVSTGAGHDAGVRHHGLALQRRRRHGALPGDAAAPAGARLEGSRPGSSLGPR